MSQTTRYDPRLAPLSLSVEPLSTPQDIYYDKAKNIRAERINGAVTLYCHDDLIKINRHPGILGTGGQGGFFGNDTPLIPLEIDGDDHKKWRRLLDPMFAPKQVARLEDSVRTLAGELLDTFGSAGSAELHSEFCVPLPCLTFLSLIGAPEDDLEFFLDFKDGVLHPKGTSVEEIDANMARSGATFLAYLVDFLSNRRAETEESEDIIAELLRSTVDGQPLAEADLLSIIFVLMFAGLDTVTSSLSCIFAWLGQHPDERQRLVDDKSLIPAAVEELLRYESPVPYGARFASEDIDLGGGLEIKQGEPIHAVWAAANVDPAAFDNPMSVQFDRGRTQHIAFASGTHRCLGSHLARLELRIAVEEVLQRIPDYVITGPVTYSNTAVRAARHLPIAFSAW
jgi:cytochrome P450